MHFAVIDVGSNSIRLEVYAQTAATSLVRRERYMTRLASGLTTGGELTAAAWQRGLAALQTIADLLTEYAPVTVAAVGTSALREATNARQFVETVQKAVGIEIRIISGTEEAELTARGILANELHIPESLLLLDIGGGSTEISVRDAGVLTQVASLSFGAVRCQEQFLVTHPPSEAALDTLGQALQRALESQFPNPRPLEYLVGSSGTLRGFCSLSGQLEEKTIADLDAVLQQFRHASLEEIRRIPGIEASRADILHAGLIILKHVCRHFTVQRIRASTFSLRHGVLESLKASSSFE